MSGSASIAQSTSVGFGWWGMSLAIGIIAAVLIYAFLDRRRKQMRS